MLHSPLPNDTCISMHLYQDLWTPLHWAAKDGKTSIAQALIRSGADLNACDKVRLYFVSGLRPMNLE